MEVPGGGGGSASLTPEQLLEYIKKQKTKIKRLEKEKETLVAKHAEEIAATLLVTAITETTTGKVTTNGESQKGDAKVAISSSSLSSNNGALFWDMLEKEPPFPRKLAKVALSMFINTIIHSNKGKQFQPSKRSLFDQWRLHTLEMRVEMAVRHATEAKANMQVLEQKTVKLKALLARTHQANKRFEEDTTSFKRAQKDAAQQLKAIKERDEEQRMALLETVRVRTIESAFQQDMELAIQRAAESNYNSNSSNNLLSSSSMSAAADKASLHALEEENNQLKTQLEMTEGSIGTLQIEAKQRQAQLDKLEKEYQRSKDALDKLSAKCVAWENQAAEHVRSRHDMELELELLTKGRADMIRCVEQSMADKSAQQIAELKAEINMLRNQQQHRQQQPKSNSSSILSNGVANGVTSTSMNKDNKAISGSKMSVARGYDRSAKTALAPSSTSSTSSLGGGLTPGLLPRNHPPVGTITALSAEEAAVATAEQQQQQHHHYPHDGRVSSPSSSSSSSTTFTCESLIIKAASDFRLVVPVPSLSQSGNFRLSWDFEVAVPSSSATTKRSGTTRVVDIGFCIMEKLSTGSLPQLLPYCRVKSPGDRNSLILGSGSTMDSSTTPSFARSLVLLFDNSYSWLQSKEIKYTITVEPVS